MRLQLLLSSHHLFSTWEENHITELRRQSDTAVNLCVCTKQLILLSVFNMQPNNVYDVGVFKPRIYNNVNIFVLDSRCFLFLSQCLWPAGFKLILDHYWLQTGCDVTNPHWSSFLSLSPVFIINTGGNTTSSSSTRLPTKGSSYSVFNNIYF